MLHLVVLAATMCAVLSAVMAVAWQVQLTTGNTGWIDVFWTFGLGAVAIIASLVPLFDGSWPHVRQIMVAILVAVWSLRLGGHILIRTRTVGDDPRYRQLITQWGTDAAREMFWQLQKQAAIRAYEERRRSFPPWVCRFSHQPFDVAFSPISTGSNWLSTVQ